MGNLCSSCCERSSSYDDLTPDPDIRRRQQLEAAEKRIAERERHGIRDIEAVKRRQQQSLEQEKREMQAGIHNQPTLKWQVS